MATDLNCVAVAAYYIAEKSGFQKDAQQCWLEAERKERARKIEEERGTKEISRASARIVASSQLNSDSTQFELTCTFLLPNACCICENVFAKGEDDQSSSSSSSAETVVPFCKLEHLCKRGCRERVHFQTLQEENTKEYIVSDLFAAFLKDPTFGRYDRVCRDCFERTMIAHVENPNVAFYSYRTSDNYWRVQITCPFCRFSQRSSSFESAYSHLFRTFNPYSQEEEEGEEDEDEERENQEDGDDDEEERPRRRRKHRTDLLDTDLLLSYLRDDARIAVQRAMDQEYERRNAIKLYCPVDGCEYCYVVATLDAETEQRETNDTSEKKEGEEEERKESNSNSDTIDCPEHGLHCTLCWSAVEKDGPHLCRNLPQSLHDCPENIRRCPKCAEAIYRITGCDNMTCARCNTQFNWKEAKRFNADGLQHYSDAEGGDGEEEAEEEDREEVEEGDREEVEEDREEVEEDREEERQDREEKHDEDTKEEEEKEEKEEEKDDETIVKWWAESAPAKDDPRIGRWNIRFHDTTTDTEIEFRRGGTFFQKAGAYSGQWRVNDMKLALRYDNVFLPGEKESLTLQAELLTGNDEFSGVHRHGAYKNYKNGELKFDAKRILGE